MKIAPSILSADFARLGAQIAECAAAGADWIHVDVMDGHFVPNITLGPVVVECIRKVTPLPLDVHLMIANPDRYLADFAKAGANRLTVHVEACPHLHRTLQYIHELGKPAGVALNPATPASAVSEVLDEVDLLLPMTVNPGFSGQKFIASVLPKIQTLREWITARGLMVELQADGGVDPETAPLLAKAGVTVFVAGNAIFKSGKSIAVALNALRTAANSN